MKQITAQIYQHSDEQFPGSQWPFRGGAKRAFTTRCRAGGAYMEGVGGMVAGVGPGRVPFGGDHRPECCGQALQNDRAGQALLVGKGPRHLGHRYGGPQPTPRLALYQGFQSQKMPPNRLVALSSHPHCCRDQGLGSEAGYHD